MANQTLLLSRRIIPHPTMILPSPRSQVLDESIIREQVLSTHNYDGRKFNTNFILSIVENILSAKMGIGEEAGVEKLNQLEELINHEELPSHIRQLSFEIEQSTPYNKERENFLWQQEANCSLDLVVGTYNRSNHYIHHEIQKWFGMENYIFLYGGNDINWIREFTSKVHQLGSKIQLKVKLAYVGKNTMIRSFIDKEKMSICAFGNSYILGWFWTRLRSMFLSRICYLDSINHFDEECNDEILQGLKKLLAYKGKNTRMEGWALLSKGNKVVVCGHGAKILQVINDYEIWKENVATKGFDEAFKDHHEMLTSSSSLKSHSCCTLEYPTTLKKITENEKCPECSYLMHKFVTFTCCHGHGFDLDEKYH
ncbi:protein SIEVE ELEMENT OCCLUSION B-like [Ipomoea triloba]|uniref:protein SIEVE ELEMENT OCCLUSION B-like n=1 Tax=Ipomoea triloba TaxID=35885 RepID=UPI00125DD130|nr:protein SIEVE ELEMENT OCCLUSION B-like [Ipomoea triloba]